MENSKKYSIAYVLNDGTKVYIGLQSTYYMEEFGFLGTININQAKTYKGKTRALNEAKRLVKEIRFIKNITPDDEKWRYAQFKRKKYENVSNVVVIEIEMIAGNEVINEKI